MTVPDPIDGPIFDPNRVVTYDIERAPVPLTQLALAIVGWGVLLPLWWPVGWMTGWFQNIASIAALSMYPFILFMLFVTAKWVIALRRFVVRRRDVRDARAGLESIYAGGDDAQLAHHAIALHADRLTYDVLKEIRARLGRPLPGLWLRVDTTDADDPNAHLQLHGANAINARELPDDRQYFTPPATCIWHAALVVTAGRAGTGNRPFLFGAIIRPALLFLLALAIVVLIVVVLAVPLWSPLPIAVIVAIVLVRKKMEHRPEPRLVSITPDAVRIGADPEDAPRIELVPEETLAIVTLESESSLCFVSQLAPPDAMEAAGCAREDAVFVAPTVEALATPWAGRLAPFLIDEA